MTTVDAGQPTLLSRHAAAVRQHSRAALLLVAFVALTTFVASGALGGFEQWSADHLMRELHPGKASASPQQVTIQAVTSTWTLPDSPTWSVALLAVLCLDWLRQRKRALPVLCVAVLAATGAVEVLCRHFVTRGMVLAKVNGSRVDAVGLSSSYPSGHVLRAVLLAGFVLAWARANTRPELRLFKRLLPAALIAWCAGVAVLVVDAGWHTPTDAAGGVLLGGAALAVCRRPLSGGNK